MPGAEARTAAPALRHRAGHPPAPRGARGRCKPCRRIRSWRLAQARRIRAGATRPQRRAGCRRWTLPSSPQRGTVSSGMRSCRGCGSRSVSRRSSNGDTDRSSRGSARSKPSSGSTSNSCSASGSRKRPIFSTRFRSRTSRTRRRTLLPPRPLRSSGALLSGSSSRRWRCSRSRSSPHSRRHCRRSQRRPAAPRTVGLRQASRLSNTSRRQTRPAPAADCRPLRARPQRGASDSLACCPTRRSRRVHTSCRLEKTALPPLLPARTRSALPRRRRTRRRRTPRSPAARRGGSASHGHSYSRTSLLACERACARARAHTHTHTHTHRYTRMRVHGRAAGPSHRGLGAPLHQPPLSPAAHTRQVGAAAC